MLSNNECGEFEEGVGLGWRRLIPVVTRRGPGAESKERERERERQRETERDRERETDRETDRDREGL
jgi:hypothetical protein